jgi:hypothetical protein
MGIIEGLLGTDYTCCGRKRARPVDLIVVEQESEKVSEAVSRRRAARLTPTNVRLSL